jgi:hypothetical protein
VVVPAGSASADAITYHMFVVAETGRLAGISSTGTITFDSSIIPPGGGKVVGLNLLTGIDFTWDGVPYTAANTQTSSLQFNAQGVLTEWEFGTACIARGGGCVVREIPFTVKDWEVANLPEAGKQFFFEYGRSPDFSFGFGTATLSATLTATPEPATFGMLLTGCVAAFTAGRRRARR